MHELAHARLGIHLARYEVALTFADGLVGGLECGREQPVLVANMVIEQRLVYARTARDFIDARRSGINKTLLYHHIGNKDRLFTAALETTYQTIRELQRDFVARQMDPETGVRQLVHLLMSIWVEHPEYGKLLASENFHGGKHVKQSKLIGEMYQQLVDALNDLLQKGAEQGLFRPGIDAIDLYISISSLSAYYVAHQHTLNAIFKIDVMNPRRLQQRENHIVDMILRYVRRHPDD